MLLETGFISCNANFNNDPVHMNEYFIYKYVQKCQIHQNPPKNTAGYSKRSNMLAWTLAM